MLEKDNFGEVIKEG